MKEVKGKKKDNKFLLIIILALLFGIMILGFVSSAGTVVTTISANTNLQIVNFPFEQPIKQGNDVFVRFLIFNGSNGVLLKNDTTYCTVNVFNVTGKNIDRKTLDPQKNFGMPSNPVACQNCWWYNISGNNFSTLGTHAVNIRCSTNDNISLGGDSMIQLDVTPNGQILSNSQATVYIIFLIAGLVLFLLTLYGAIKIKWKPDTDEDGKIINKNKIRYFKPVLFAFAYILLLWISGILYSIMSNYLYFDNASQIFNWIYNILLALLIPITICTFFFAIVVFFQDRKWRKKAIRGFKR